MRYQDISAIRLHMCSLFLVKILVRAYRTYPKSQKIITILTLILDCRCLQKIHSSQSNQTSRYRNNFSLQHDNIPITVFQFRICPLLLFSCFQTFKITQHHTATPSHKRIYQFNNSTFNLFNLLFFLSFSLCNFFQCNTFLSF